MLLIDRIEVKKPNFHLRLSNLEVKRSEISALLGPSGSGKSTLLKSLCGFEETVILEWTLEGHNMSQVPPRNRHIGYVSQDSTVFSEVSALSNIRAVNRSEKSNQQWLRDVGLKDRAGVKASKLSGGERQRLAFAMALSCEPNIVLLDEPFSSLNNDLKIEMADLLVSWQAENKKYVIVSIHDEQLAKRISNSSIRLEDGRQIDSL